MTVPRTERPARGRDIAALRRLVGEGSSEIGPCNRRCAAQGRCAFGRADAGCHWCREVPPVRPES